MRKIIFQNMMTLDGFFAGPNNEIDWHMVDDEFNQFAINNLNQLDGLIFGRKTYQLMADYWPSEMGLNDDPMVAAKMNSLPKIVFSRTLKKLDWNNSRLVNDQGVEELVKLKGQNGKDFDVFGSANLAETLMRHNLIDEFRIFINPVILGGGIPLFAGLKSSLKLKLINFIPFKNGLVLLVYETAAK